jgi:ABC-2 type transport system ATP-binding protein
VLGEAVAGADLTVLFSSHLVSDLDRVCDHLILLAAAEVRLCGDIAGILGSHKVLTGPADQVPAVSHLHEVVNAAGDTRCARLLVRARGPVLDTAWQVRDPNLEEVVVAYMGRATAGPGAAGAAR